MCLSVLLSSLLFIHFSFDATVLSLFLFAYCGYHFSKSLILKSSLRIFLLTLTLRLLAIVTMSQCLLVTLTSESVATMYECNSIYADQAIFHIMLAGSSTAFSLDAKQPDHPEKR